MSYIPKYSLKPTGFYKGNYSGWEMTLKPTMEGSVAALEQERHKLRERVKELEAEIAELKSCPNESWECAKEQRRLEVENARLREVVEAAKVMRNAKLGRGFSKACADFDSSLRELDAEGQAAAKGE